MRYHILIMLLLVGVLGCQKVGQASSVYKSRNDIPEILMQGIDMRVPRERYLHDHLKVIREYGEDHSVLTPDSIKRAEENMKRSTVRQQIVEVLGYDRNYDGSVTREEIKEHFIERRKRDGVNELNKNDLASVDRVMLYDVNHDGIINLDEMIRIPEAKHSGYQKKIAGYQSYLDLDPNKDGRLTWLELEHLARNAFDVFDENGNGIIDRTEHPNYREHQARTNSMDNQNRVREECKIEGLLENQQLYVLKVYQAARVSDITIGGEDKVTGVIDVHVEKDVVPSYIFLDSAHPIIWRLTGETKNILGVIVNGVVQTKNHSSPNGVIGIEKDKVYFVKHGCVKISYRGDDAPSKNTQMFKDITGSVPYKARDEHMPLSFTIKTNDIVMENMPDRYEAMKAEAPEGFNQPLWSQFMFFNPGGFITLNTNEIVSQIPAEKLKTLPEMAEMSKLVGSGHIEIIKNQPIVKYVVEQPHGNVFTISARASDKGNAQERFGGKPAPFYSYFRIVKSIPYYPASIDRAAGTVFLLADDVDVPKGKLNRTCVIRHKTGEVISGTSRCENERMYAKDLE